MEALNTTLGLTQCVSSATSFFFFSLSLFSGVINGKNEYLDIRWIIIVVVLTCIFFIALIFIFVQRRKVAGFPFFLLLLLSGFRDLESGAVTRLCLAQDR